jgi:hypothetical protein
MKPLFTAAALAISVVASTPVFADPATDILGTYRDTSKLGDWMVKSLGTSSDWEGGRSYTNGDLDTTGYDQANAVDRVSVWAEGIPWISHEQSSYGVPDGYYSYVTIINDSSFTGTDPTLSFSGLSINFAVDDLLIAFVINGMTYDGFTAQSDATFDRYEDIFIPSGVNIPWNVGGNNTVEIIVQNGDYTGLNPTGLSVAIQASYAPIPEPETWAMLLAGLGIVGAVARRRRLRVN